MQKQLLVNRESNLLTLFEEVPKQNPYISSDYNNMKPNTIKTIKTIYPIRQDNDGTIDTRFKFNLPLEGFLVNTVIQTTLTCTGDNTNIEELLGARIFKNIFLKQNNRIIQTLTSEYIISRIDDSGSENRDALIHSTEPEDNWNNNTVTVFTPLFLSVLESKEKLLLNFTSALEIEIELNLDLNLASPITALEPVLQCFINNHEDSFYKDHILTFFKEENRSLNYDIHCDEIEVATNSTSTTLYLTSNHLVTSMHFLIKKQSGHSIHTIDTVAFYNDGEPIFEVSSRLNLFDNAFKDIRHNAGNRAIVYNFSGSKTNRNNHSGALNLASMSDAKYITVTYPTITQGHVLYVICEYLTIIEKDLYGNLFRNINY